MSKTGTEHLTECIVSAIRRYGEEDSVEALVGFVIDVRKHDATAILATYAAFERLVKAAGVGLDAFTHELLVHLFWFVTYSVTRR